MSDLMWIRDSRAMPWPARARRREFPIAHNNIARSRQRHVGSIDDERPLVAMTSKVEGNAIVGIQLVGRLRHAPARRDVYYDVWDDYWPDNSELPSRPCEGSSAGGSRSNSRQMQSAARHSDERELKRKERRMPHVIVKLYRRKIGAVES